MHTRARARLERPAALMSTPRKLLIYGTGFLLGLLVVIRFFPKAEGPQAEERLDPPRAGPITWTDDRGRSVELPRAPRRVVSLAPSLTQMVYALGLGDRLVAVTRWDDYPEAARALRDSGAHVGDLHQPNRELITQLMPDLILAHAFTPPDVVALLHQPPRTSAAVFEHDRWDDVLSDLATVAHLLGEPQAALGVLRALAAEQAQLEARVEAARAAHPGPAPSVVLLYSLDTDLSPGTSPGAGTWAGDLIERAGADHASAALATGWGQLGREGLLSLDPDVLLFIDGETEDARQRLQEQLTRLSGDAYWRQLQAVRTGRLYRLPPGPWNIPGPRGMEALEALIDVLWGEVER